MVVLSFRPPKLRGDATILSKDLQLDSAFMVEVILRCRDVRVVTERLEDVSEPSRLRTTVVGQRTTAS